MRIALPFVLCAAIAAQHTPETFGHSHHGATFDEGPRTAAYHMPGLGDQVHFPVAGLSDEAQRFFDQGVTQQHGFWYFEAERSFRQVAALQPECAMAYWGMAMANVENPKRAAGFLCRAVQKSADVPAREQRWIDAWARYYQIDDAVRAELRSGDEAKAKAAIDAQVAKVDGDKDEKAQKKRDERLIEDLGTIVYEDPDDIEAKAFLALQNWLAYGWGSGIPIVSHAAIDALLQQVFDKAPLHPAHHYRIHLWDQKDARRALGSAAKNGSSAPAIAHQWHMPGHIYAKLHRHAEAAWQQEASSRADHAHMMRDAVMPFLIHNYGHNQEWLARSLAHTGRLDEALQIAKNLAELPRHPRWNELEEGDSIAGYARTRLVQLCEDFGLWDEAQQLAAAGYLEPTADVLAEVQRLALAGRAAFRRGRIDDGERVIAEVGALLTQARVQRAVAVDEAEQKAFDAKEKRPKLQEAIAEAAKRPTDAVQAVLELQRELRGEQLLAAGDAAGALAEFEAVQGFSKLLLADAQVAAGKVDDAITALEKENDKNPHRAATMAALLRAYVAKGDDAKGKQVELMGALTRDTAPTFWARCGVGVDLGLGHALAGGEVSETDGFGDDFGQRPPLATLGPRTWSPTAAPGFDLEGINLGSSDGARMTLAQPGHRRATLVVFYLGFGCLHCVEQLHLLRPKAAEFAALGVDVVAIGSDDVATTRKAFADLAADERMPFPMLCDPTLATFKKWHCFDDFENMTLHGTFLVDADGRVRWQDISYEPFTEIDWLLKESRRLLALPVAN
ncbi:MAG: redoxin domain-containing protein [Planctomycetes bacterium]|nr:redoxin domain-containing protein [Planctomycetota bacterium]